MSSTATRSAALQVSRSVHETYQLVRDQQRSGKRVGLVPTMGALHAGHFSLIERSISQCDFTVASIFVNPTQFSQPEDFSKYPRTWDNDLAQLKSHKVDLVFAPTVEAMYPTGFSTNVEVLGVTKPWEGEFRPGHFRGVTTVVLKLFQIAPADRAYFGRKDYQQVLAVQQMVNDLNLPIEIVVCPLVRDADGLALSSRNALLSPDERRQALVLSRSLNLAREEFASGQRDTSKLRDSMQRLISAEPAVRVEYLAIVDPLSLTEVPQVRSSAVALIAARVGKIRLIDNEILSSDRP